MASKTPTSFLSLPRELCHQILFQSYERNGGSHDEEFYVDFRWLDAACLPYHAWLKFGECLIDPQACYGEPARDWSIVLRKVDERLAEDIDYVVKAIKGQVEKLRTRLDNEAKERMMMSNDNQPPACHISLWYSKEPKK